ncbi:MAG: DMT family transporter [Burkholderiales bacterium]|nr:DMT family transporter [Burkholderiales bacterium]
MSAAAYAHTHSPRGPLLIMTAVALFVVMDTMSKYLSRFYPVPAIVWARYFFHVLLVLIILGPRLGLGLVRTRRLGVQLLRGLLLAGSTLFFVFAISQMPLAETSSITFIAPVLVTLMGAFFLKERVEAARWLAVAGGFAGVLIIIRPGGSVFTWASLLPICCATCFAGYQILTRKLANLESPYTSIFYSGLVGSVLMSFTLPFVWLRPQSLYHAFLFVAIGIIGGLSHLILIKAYDYAPASQLAPFSYTQLIWVTLMGYLVFGHFPDHWSLIGIAVIMASGIYIATHQQLSDRQQRAELRETTPGA